MTALCPVCGGELPPAKPRGRPRQFCTLVCGNRAALRRRQAAGLLEYAHNLEAHVGERAYGSEAYLLGQIGRLRADAAELLASIGEGAVDAARRLV